VEERIEWNGERSNLRYVGIIFRKAPDNHCRQVALPVHALEQEMELTL